MSYDAIGRACVICKKKKLRGARESNPTPAANKQIALPPKFKIGQYENGNIISFFLFVVNHVIQWS